jgi:Ca2+-binding EF-hand superfamily protein
MLARRAMRLGLASIARPPLRTALAVQPQNRLAGVVANSYLLQTARPLSDLSKLVGKAPSNEALRALYDDMASGRNGIPVSELAEKLAASAGFDGEQVKSAAGGLAYGTDPLSFVVKLQMQWAVSGMDTNGDSVISWDELLQAVRAAEAQALEAKFFSPKALEVLGIETFDCASLRLAFDAADGDASGDLDKAEITAMFLRVNPALERSPEFASMVDSVLGKLDTDGNKSVSWEEFKSAFLVYQSSFFERAAIFGVS